MIAETTGEPPSVWVVLQHSYGGDGTEMVIAVWTTREAAVQHAGGRYSVSEVFVNDPNGWEADDPRDRAIHAQRRAEGQR